MAAENEAATAGDSQSLIFVGIGASAGGLEAARELVGHLLPGKRLTYVLAQHLSPTHASMLTNLVARDSRMPVQTVQSGVTPQPNHIYITPPNYDIELADGRLVLSAPRSGPMPKPNINRFFRSLAEDAGADCAGIILSGTGTDGAAGMMAIKAAGGITIAQEPRSSQYDGMPLASIHADAADLVQPPEQIAGTLRALDEARLEIADPGKGETDLLQRVMVLVRQGTGIDLSGYKANTVRRRLRRRMSLHHLSDLAAYLELLEDDPAEVEALGRDAFVGVTGFFRDSTAFEALDRQLPPLLAEARSELRIWVPGCASGEEAYSLAILLEERARQAERHIDFRIFATDLAPDGMNVARLGVYPPDALTAVSAALIERHFQETPKGFAIARRLRDRVLFSTHDLTRDPPFSRLDLVSCRNVMIYFNTELQQQILQTLAYALRPGGLLLLGKAESIGHSTGAFEALDPEHRVYRKSADAVDEAPGWRMPPAVSRTVAAARREQRSLEEIEPRLLRLLASRFAPATLVVNQNNEVMYSWGDLASTLSVRSGPVSLDLFDMMRENLRAPVRALLYKARGRAAQGTEAAESMTVPDGDSGQLRCTAQPFDPNRPGWMLLTLQPVPGAQCEAATALLRDNDRDRDRPMVTALEHELFSTRESLQTVVEELETTNEELQAANEELQSANEEFLATNEQLQTTNQELQSSNEELLTLNEELQEKTRQREALANDLLNIQESLETPLLVVDAAMRVRRYVPALDQLIPLEDIREDDLVTALPWRGEIFGLRRAIEEVIAERRRFRSIIRIDGKVWQLQITPFVGRDEQAEGAVLVFTDTTELVETQERYGQEKDRALVTLQSVADGVIRTDASGRVEYLNPAAESVLGWAEAACEGLSLDEVFPLITENGSRPGNPATRAIANDAVVRSDADTTVRDRYGKQVCVEYQASPTRDSHGTVTGCVVAFRDVTEQRNALRSMVWASSHDDLTGTLNRREMEQRLATALEAIRQGRQRETAFLFMDLDRFKTVNDSCGHLVGDEMLRRLAELIQAQLRRRDLLARLGGDEFGVLLDGCPLPESLPLAEKVRTAVDTMRFSWQEKEFRVGVSIGLVALTADTTDISSLLRDADAACYRAKAEGRNRIEVHGSEGPDAAP